MQEVSGSIPLGSTSFSALPKNVRHRTDGFAGYGLIHMDAV